MLDYLSFFGFKENPFGLTPNTKYFYPSYVHSVAYELLRYGILRGEGFFVLVGLPGTGKTLLLRRLMNNLPSSFATAFIITPSLSSEELFSAVLSDLGFDCVENSKLSLIQKIYDLLLSFAKQEKKLLLIIDEAQNLSESVLEDLRLLSNLETENDKLIQIVLSGQPNLAKKLLSYSLAQLYQRVSVWASLEPLSFKDFKKYIYFRLSLSGNSRFSFTDMACKLIYRVTKGIPRQINKFMDRCLLVAAARKTSFIDAFVVLDALDGFSVPLSFWRKARLFLSFS